MAVKSSVETWIAMGVSWRKISITLIDNQKGETKAQACEIACVC
jgi:hypothetical protein